MCVLYMSCGSKVKPKTFGCIYVLVFVEFWNGDYVSQLLYGW